MKESLVISISTIGGTRHFHVGKWYRHFWKGFSYFFVFGLLTLAGVIYYLSSEVDFAKLKQKELETESLSLNEEVTSLKALQEELQNDVLEREEKMQIVSDRLGDLEKVLGVDDSQQTALEDRLDIAAINSSVRVVMLNSIPNGRPVKVGRLSSEYGKRVHPITGKVKFHRGQDFAVKKGTPIYAPADGVVEVTRPSHKGSGNYMRLEHAFGFTSSYSHMSKFNLRMGDFVQKGDIIGYSGNTGLSSGPHLHYEVRFVGRSLNPKPFVEWGLNDFDTIFTKIEGIRWESLVNNVEQRVSAQLQLSLQKDAQSVDKSK
ncbi:M23 family metallopeptidase [Vibrio palustris]|uniref:Murein DD-endopeptidase MepM n=1 Tax=Vibrio palustris TaxID=1918946 RepID=A0A1R4B5Z3_9VIBR|nr:M23 family metallopeptidase [Vibrio palustris]SJL84342.1 Murein DD-endopeptidase MepM [Vibrio palustris]